MRSNSAPLLSGQARRQAGAGGRDRGAELLLRRQPLAHRLLLESPVALGERLVMGRGEGGIVAAVEPDGRFVDARRGGRGLGIAIRRETSEVDRLGGGVEADVAAPAALVDAAVGGGDADLPALPALPALAALDVSADPALRGGGGGERLGPAGLEGGIAAARAVEAHEAETGGGGRVLAGLAPPEAGQERLLGPGADAALTPARLVLPAHPQA